MKTLTTTVALVMLLAPGDARADRIDDLISEQMMVSQLPGAAVAVIDDGKVTKLSAYGRASLEWPAKVDADTRFQLASATKIFTGILLMRSVEQGRLSLEDPVAKFFPGAPESWSRIRVRQLANHTSGLSEDLGQPRPKTVAEAVAASMKQPLAYAPGSEARYGFTDFTILRAILEQVNGVTLPELLRREVTGPLGLNGTGFAMAADEDGVRTSEVIPKRASIYGWNGERQRRSDFFFEPLGYGAGGLYSTISDLARLFAEIDQGRVMSPESLRELTTPATLPNGRKSGFGVGWTVREYHGVAVVGHSGGPALADILRIPSQKRTIVVLTNQQNFYPLLAERIADLTIAPPPVAFVPDDRPAIAFHLVDMFKAVASGQDERAFVAPGSKPAEPLRSAFGKALLAGVGPLSDATLVRVEADESRVYRLRFSRKIWDWRVEADSQGRISDLRPN